MRKYRAVLLAMAIAVSGSHAMADDGAQLRARIPTDQLIDMWEQNEYACISDNSGQLNQSCIQRTYLAGILNRRGYCQSALPADAGAWRPCVVRGGRSAYFAPGGAYDQRNRSSY